MRHGLPRFLERCGSDCLAAWPPHSIIARRGAYLIALYRLQTRLMFPKVRRAYFSLFINVFCVRIFNAADKKEFIKAPLYYSLAVALSDVIPNSLDYVCFLCGARLRRTPHRKEIRGGGFAAPATPP